MCMVRAHERIDAGAEIGLHAFEESDLDVQCRTARKNLLPYRREGCCPIRIARSVREQYESGTHRPVLPKPPAPRPLASNSWTTLKPTCTTGTTTS